MPYLQIIHFHKNFRIFSIKMVESGLASIYFVK